MDRGPVASRLRTNEPPAARSAVIAAIAVTAFALFFGTDLFSHEYTAPILQWVANLFGLTDSFRQAAEPSTEEGWLRKTAHVLVYALLAVMWCRALVQLWPKWPRWKCIVSVWLIALGVASLDELQQRWLSSFRTGSIWDVLVDSAGAAAALLVLLLWGDRRADEGKRGTS